MKYLFLLFILCYLSNFSQNNDVKKHCNYTVFKTVEDYKNNIGIVGNDISWGTHFTWIGPENVLRLKLKDSTIKFLSGTVFGFIDTNCILRRFYNEHTYVITLNKDIGFSIYKHRVSGYSKYGVYANTNYYFSKDVYSKIFVLNKSNLKKEFNQDSMFISEINKIKNLDKLIKIDTITKNYKLVDIFLKTHKK